MTSTARQLRQPPTIKAIERVPYFADACLVEGGFSKGDFGVKRSPKEIAISSSLVLRSIYLIPLSLNKLFLKVSSGGD